nr:MAG TPA: Prokaryotic membrane lipoprotein lipid attachment site [Caudoviricetes sp.]
MNSIRKMLMKCAGVRMACIFLAAVMLGGCTPRNVTKGMEQVFTDRKNDIKEVK